MQVWRVGMRSNRMCEEISCGPLFLRRLLDLQMNPPNRAGYIRFCRALP